MSGTFQEPETLATFDRSYGDKHEELRLEKGEYNGRPTFTLRLYWKTEDDQWRWSSQKPSQSGKCWERLNLKARELRELGEALIAAAGSSNVRPAQTQRRGLKSKPDYDDHLPAPDRSKHDDDNIPF